MLSRFGGTNSLSIDTHWNNNPCQVLKFLSEVEKSLMASFYQFVEWFFFFEADHTEPQNTKMITNIQITCRLLVTVISSKDI